MKDILDLVSQIIIVDIFIGFGLYSIAYVLITLFKKDIKFLNELDVKATRFIIFSGLLFSLLVVIGILDGVDTGRQYWWAPWIQVLVWILITQLFWIKRVRTISVLRVILAIPLILSFERYVILVTSLHRDYIPASWTSVPSWITPTELVAGLTIKVFVFCLLSVIYSYIVDRLRRIKPGAVK